MPIGCTSVPLSSNRSHHHTQHTHTHTLTLITQAQCCSSTPPFQDYSVLVARAAPATLPPNPVRNGVPGTRPIAPWLCVRGRGVQRLLGAALFLPFPWHNPGCAHRRRATAFAHNARCSTPASVVCGRWHRRALCRTALRVAERGEARTRCGGGGGFGEGPSLTLTLQNLCESSAPAFHIDSSFTPLAP